MPILFDFWIKSAQNLGCGPFVYPRSTTIRETPENTSTGRTNEKCVRNCPPEGQKRLGKMVGVYPSDHAMHACLATLVYPRPRLHFLQPVNVRLAISKVQQKVKFICECHANQKDLAVI